MRLQLAARNERIRRRKADREKKIKEQQEKELALLSAEKNRLREEAEAEKLAHKQQIERLEAELKRVRSSMEQQSGSEMEHSEQEDFGEHYKEKSNSKKRGRSKSTDSRHESVASTVGAYLLNLPTGYRAVKCTKLNSSRSSPP